MSVKAGITHLAAS